MDAWKRRSISPADIRDFSSEVIDILRVCPERGYYVEWSVNEKVALENALAAAWCGVRALCTMKHVGLNVAADFP